MMCTAYAEANRYRRIRRSILSNPRIWLGVLAASLSSPAWANSAIPGPMIWFGSSLSVSPLQWLVVCMLMCIGIEGAIYRYVGAYRRPFGAATYANIVSLIMGIPLGLFVIIDPSHFIVPTLFSILVEYWALKLVQKRILKPGATFSASPIIWGNVLTNLMMLFYLIVVAPYKTG